MLNLRMQKVIYTNFLEASEMLSSRIEEPENKDEKRVHFQNMAIKQSNLGQREESRKKLIIAKVISKEEDLYAEFEEIDDFGRTMEPHPWIEGT